MRFFTLSMIATMVAFSLTACSKEPKPETASLTASAPAGASSDLVNKNTIQQLKTTLEQHFQKAQLTNIEIKDIQPVQGSDLYWVNSNEGSVFVTADGKYVLQGQLLELGGNQVVDVAQRYSSVKNKELLAGLKAEDLIIYPATGEKKHTIYVFSDVSCSYCQRLHRNMSEMNAQGIEVRYIAWPRGEQLFPAMESIWCSADRKKAFDDTMNGTTLPTATCANPVRTQFELGQQMGVTGTPAIFTEYGQQIGGYLDTDDMLSALQSLQK